MPNLKPSTSQIFTIIPLIAALSACGGSSSNNNGGSNLDTTAPTVINITPTNSATNVSRTAPITVAFSEAMFGVSIDNSSFTLNSNNEPVAATVSLNTSTNTASLQPSSKLSNLSSYTATLTTDIADLAGNALTEEYSWSFNTEDGSWGTAQSIKSGAGDAAAPQIAVDSSGNALAIWYQDNGTIDTTRVNRYSAANNSWGIATPIEINAGHAYDQQIAIDSNGNALAVWKQADGAIFSIRAARYSAANNSWEASKLIELHAENAEQPQIAIDGNGNALVVWMQREGVQNHIWANRYSADDNQWGTAELIQTTPGNAAPPQIAIDNSGNGIAVWHQLEGSLGNIWANRYSMADSSWGEATVIETEAGYAHFPHIAIDGIGNALVVWVQNHSTQYSIWANRFTVANGDWGTAELIERDAGDANLPRIAVDKSGNALAIWRQWDGAQYSISTNRYNMANDSWGVATKMEVDADYAYYSQIAFDSSGNALAIWRQNEGLEQSIWANRYSMVNDRWSTAVKIESDTGNAEHPQIAIDSSGNSWAIWKQHDGTHDSIVVNHFN